MPATTLFLFGTAVVLLLLLPAAVSAVGPAFEVVANGGFEKGTTEGWNADNWQVVAGTEHGGTFAAFVPMEYSNDYYISQSVDFTGVDTLTFWYLLTGDEEGNPGVSCEIDNVNVFAGFEKEQWAQGTVDTSSYTGIHTISFFVGSGVKDLYIDDVSAMSSSRTPVPEFSPAAVPAFIIGLIGAVFFLREFR